MKSNPRIVSLIASATEIVAALGYADCIVACSHECDYPDTVNGLPRITRAKLRTDVPSLEIDRQVKDILRAGLSVYAVDADRLRELRPDIIVTQDHCEVCAVSTKDLEAAACDVLGEHVQVVSLRPNSLADIWADIKRVADALGDPARGDRLVASLQARLDDISARTRTMGDRPRVAFIEWVEPLMAGGNWVPELIAMAHANDLLGRPGEHSDWIEFDQVRDVDPDIIVVAPCGFDVARTIQEMPALTQKQGFQELRAAQEGRVYVADGNAYFNRPGPRLVESFEILAEMLYDGKLDFGHRNNNWQRYPA